MSARFDARHPLQIVGRDVELGLLESLLERLRSGRSGSAVLEGEAGIGKSALVEMTLQHGRSAGLRSFLAIADELDQEQPFGVVTQLFARAVDDEHRGRRGGDPLFPAAATDRLGGSSIHGASRMEEELVDLVEAVTGAGPILLVVEDAQWCDEASLRAFRRLVRRAVEFRSGSSCLCDPVVEQRSRVWLAT